MSLLCKHNAQATTSSSIMTDYLIHS